MSLLYINASHRDERAETDSSNFILNLPHSYTGVKNVELLLYNLPNSIKNVYKGKNDTIVFSLPETPQVYVDNPFVNENTAKDYVVTLQEGFYSATDLRNSIQLKAQEVFTADGRSENIKVDLDELDNRFIFSEENDYVFRINGSHPDHNIDEEIIGLPFNFNKYGGKTFWHKSVKLQNSVNLMVKQIFLTILINDHSGYDVMDASGNFFASFVLPIDNVWGAVLFGRGLNKITFKYPQYVSRLRIKWFDHRGRSLKMDTPWDLTLSLS